jgi:hypothetical protein
MFGGLIDAILGPSWADKLNDFADRVAGSMDGLRDKLRMLGAEGDTLWSRLSGEGMNKAEWIRSRKNVFEDTEAALDRLTVAQQNASKHFDLLSSAVQRFGGVAPRALHATIDGLLQLPGLTNDMRAALEGLKGQAGIDALQQAAQRYGKTINDLGQNIAQLGSNDAFDQLFSDFTLFTDAGGDVNAVFDAMQDKINEAVNRARKMGLAVPEFMRPLLEQMLSAGRLTDEFGTKLTDLNGITFSASIESSLERIAGILERIATFLAPEGPIASSPVLGRTIGDLPVIGTAGPRETATSGGTAIIEINSQTLAEVLVPAIPGIVQRYRLA